MSNELERRGIYRMMYDTYVQTDIYKHIHINIVGDDIWPVWGSFRLAPNNIIIIIMHVQATSSQAEATVLTS